MVDLPNINREKKHAALKNRKHLASDGIQGVRRGSPEPLPNLFVG